ncbi:hypothetical protein SPRG_19276 [Saprolegnia parasitica CBS 223.65]|uniref:CLASP N-terminal domain-containing protein n=1 Tax=Saprolegnia parasitica (strain CBS 223.65) TaxID=695850 RepID=A0A067CWR3_SAPPC|nr:hypothetical protein SPRG_19276 [Saprolegnia parasitica CBS 223.65]KDO33665.1 hypothetical protein SPRG_19276 [Saprolegnia parasitica CBS 223.65]|eukprot:XP_012195693.1 hypothetical protein SPRG_19276 [Saprolegnia parasitica CBS 223.65]
MERLAAQSERCLRLLREDAEWQDKTQQLLDLQEVLLDVQATGALTPIDPVLALLKPLAPHLTAMLGDIRSSVVKTTCSVLAAIATACGPDLAPFIDEILLGVLNTAYVKVRVMSSAGETCLETISKRSRYSLLLLQAHFAQTKHADVRHLCIAQFPFIMSSWLKPELDAQYATMKNMLAKALQDNDDKVRRKAREAFCMFSEIWDDHMDEFVLMPQRTTRESIIKEYPLSRLAQELRRKHGEPVPKRTPLKQRMATTPEASIASEESSDSVPPSPNTRATRPRPESKPITRSVSVPTTRPSVRPNIAFSSSMSSQSSDDVAIVDLDEELARRDEAESLHVASERTPQDVADDKAREGAKTTPRTISVPKQLMDTVVWVCTALSLLFAIYGLTGALWSVALLGSPSSAISLELQDVEDAVLTTLFEFRAHEAHMDAWVHDVAQTMDAYRRDASDQVARLHDANAVWNRSMRDDMAAFTAEFVAKIKFDPTPSESSSLRAP